MPFKLDFILKNNILCFRRYLTYYSLKIHGVIENKNISVYTLEEYISYLKIAELDKRFFDTLTKDEKIDLSKWTENKRDRLLETALVKRAFEKWKDIFFGNKFNYLFEELNPKNLGLVLKGIREQACKSKSEIAELMNIHRKTIILVEKGDRLPSLQYIYKFSKIFNIKINDILELCVI